MRKAKKLLRAGLGWVPYECNTCGAHSNDDDRLALDAGKACPYCGEGVIVREQLYTNTETTTGADGHEGKFADG